jgi:hypothetical protein
MPEPVKFTMQCRMCPFHRTVSVSGTIQPGMSQEQATKAIADQSVRAEDNFFRDHWGRVHPAEAQEITHHIEQVAKLGRVTTYHKRVMETTIEGPGEQPPMEAGAEP